LARVSMLDLLRFLKSLNDIMVPFPGNYPGLLLIVLYHTSARMQVRMEA
jgi:hypothetical protein